MFFSAHFRKKTKKTKKPLFSGDFSQHILEKKKIWKFKKKKLGFSAEMGGWRGSSGNEGGVAPRYFLGERRRPHFQKNPATKPREELHFRPN